LSGAIRAATDTGTTGETYRRHTKRLLVGAASFSMFSFLLGRPADQPISRWDEMFVPMLMRDYLRTIRVRDESGALVPLVKREWRAFIAQRAAERRGPPKYVPGYTIAGVLLGAAIVALTLARGPGSPPRRLGASLAATWSVLAGLAGLATISAWAFTRHVFMYDNENVLQLTPLSLALAVFIALAARPAARRGKAWIALALAVVIVALSVFGLVAKFQLGYGQSNHEIIGLALPLHVATVVAVVGLLRRGDAGSH
jgi:4-amino-4-deoxy-L-arabinose transferase-like glycosyltransferase